MYVSGALISSTTITAFHLNDEVDTDPGVSVQIFTHTAASNLHLTQFGVSCDISGVWELKKGASVLFKGRTAPGKPDSSLKLATEYPILSGESFELVFTARTGSPVCPVFGFVSAKET